MKKTAIAILVLMFLITACQTVGRTPSNEADVTAETSPTVVPTPESTAFPEASFAVVGDAELVFDWSEDRCEDESIPDIAARAFRDADGMVQLLIGHYVTYRMVGTDLNEVVSDCIAPVFTSDFDPDPAMFNDAEWIGSVYTEDGETVYAVIHNEYRGHLHGDVLPDQCPSGDYLKCMDVSLTLAISTDGARAFLTQRKPPAT